MKKVIKSSRADEIRKARDEWEAEDARRANLRKQEEARYQKAMDEVVAPVEYEIDSKLRRFDALEFEVNVSRSRSYARNKGLEVNVRCNQSRIHDETSALSWNWDVRINEDGEVIKDSGSWSGLNATNEASMNSLRQSVAALEFLNSLDWPTLIDVETPDYSAYYTDESRPQPNKPKFREQLKVAELSEYIGKGIALKGDPYYEDTEYRGTPDIYYVILGETPKQFKVGRASVWEIRRWVDNGQSQEEVIENISHWSSRVKKERLLEALDYPYIELDINNL